MFWKPDWQSLLSNGTVNNPQLNNLTGIVYGAPQHCLYKVVFMLTLIQETITSFERETKWLKPV
jgi:hypothetical protein